MSSFYSDASLVMIPSGYKTSKVYSAKPTDGAGDLTFTRSNDTATRVGPDGLIEKVRTNLALYSEQFDNAYWTKSQATITANATTAPDGTLTAEKFIEGSGSVAPECARTPIATSNSIFTLSVFAKASERNFLIINNNDGTGSFRVWFNLTTGVIGTTDAGVTAFIENVGNGWFRCGVARQITAFASATSAFQIGSADGVETYTGDGTSGIFIWGAQMELSDFGPTDYIATTSAAVSVGPVANVPRLDYLGSSCPRLLLEPQRTNVITNNNDFATGASNVTTTANNATSPEGYQNADLITGDAGTLTKVTNFNAASAGQYTVSVFAKYNTQQWIQLGAGGIASFANFDIQNGVVGTTNATSSIEDYGNGWYRCSLNMVSGTPLSHYVGIITNGTSARLSTTASTDSFWAYGIQSELGTYPTSVIPTLGAAVTRGADISQKSSISGLFGATATTFVLDFVKKENAIGWTITGGNGSKLFSLCQFDTLAGQPRVVFDDGVDTGSSLAALSNGPHKIAISYATNDTRVYIDGTLILTDTSCTYYQMDRIGVNATAWTGFTNNTNAFEINQFLMIPAATSNADLAALTA